MAGRGLTPAARAFIANNIGWEDCTEPGALYEDDRARLASAWALAARRARDRRWPTVRDAVALSRLVSEYNRRGGYAVGPDGFRSRHMMIAATLCIGPRFVRTWMDRLFSPEFFLRPDEFYRRFEHIHPFVDGNGRVGVLLHNWLRGTLDRPASPPWFWGEYEDGDPTRRVG